MVIFVGRLFRVITWPTCSAILDTLVSDNTTDRSATVTVKCVYACMCLHVCVCLFCLYVCMSVCLYVCVHVSECSARCRATRCSCVRHALGVMTSF